MKLKDFVSKLNTLYPLENKEIWDPSGYSVKFNQAKKLKGVMLAIDVTKEVIEAAISNDCNIIVTHHPFYFEATKILENEKAPYKKELHKLLKEHQITTFGMHTNYDCDPKGTSYQIVRALGLEQFVDPQSDKFSAILNYMISIADLKKLIEEKLDFHSFRTNVIKDDLDKKMHQIAFLSGSGYVGQINDLAARGVDLIVSSDFRWSDWINFRETGINILEIPHLDEQVFVDHLAELLSLELPKERIFKFKMKEPYQNL
ncbi:Nif3-like dinuclear metal center hexameric protein [Mycoplasmopsis gallopavonis]|uniref:GTP cyclohydrolase 1 type 2 homolog n=1 Tax=Mycoplasmopsis gallopavonis TaxID=76629 RepID=A0A449B089_9BACT|nr:Nif3-like dinuclear metal center hexameric protein [Mycoplasmopsis gallopavonis]RIV16717.1 Nif3-like dinuclear metal center hexameric protein [Mycoplasmopsis gallopavonis]VEU73175.1 metal-binding protein [Mycoplasmopsis gallopavonis]